MVGRSGLARLKAMSQKRDPFGKLRAGYGAPKFEAAFESGPPAIGREAECVPFRRRGFAERGGGCGAEGAVALRAMPTSQRLDMGHPALHVSVLR